MASETNSLSLFHDCRAPLAWGMDYVPLLGKQWDSERDIHAQRVVDKENDRRGWQLVDPEIMFGKLICDKTQPPFDGKRYLIRTSCWATEAWWCDDEQGERFIGFGGANIAEDDVIFWTELP